MGGMGSGRKPNPNTTDPDELQQSRANKVTHLFAHPRLDTVPTPEFPMGDKGKLKYRELAEMLLKSGQLTTITRGYAESAAIAFEQIYQAQSSGKNISASLLTQYNRALGNITQLDVDRNLTGTPQKENRFRYAGFASRLHPHKANRS